MTSAPKYSKIELLKISKQASYIPSTDKLTFHDCGIMITGDYIVIIIDDRDEENNSNNSTGEIFPLA